MNQRKMAHNGTLFMGVTLCGDVYVYRLLSLPKGLLGT